MLKHEKLVSEVSNSANGWITDWGITIKWNHERPELRKNPKIPLMQSVGETQQQPKIRSQFRADSH
jgi:hypothetical protein